MKKICFIPMGGLCNRLRGIASAVYWKHRWEAELEVVWFTDPGCGASWSDLFEPLEGVRWRELPSPPKRRQVLARPWLWPVRFAADRWINASARKACFDLVLGPDQMAARDFQIPAPEPSRRRVLAESYSRFAPLPPGDFARFKPLRPLRDQIDAVCAPFGTDVIGVHARRSDHVDSSQQSPDESFVRTLASLLEKDPAQKFFISSDDEAFCARLTGLFPQNVLSRQRRISRSSVEGMQDAVVDLFVLSRCRFILGSCGSTFSMTAADLGDVPIGWIRLGDGWDEYRF